MIHSLILFLSKLPFIILIIIATGGIVIGDYYSKIYSITPSNISFSLMILGYIICGFFFTSSLFKEDLIFATIALEVLYLVGMLLIGYFIFGETLTKMQFLGALISIIGISILLLSE